MAGLVARGEQGQAMQLWRSVVVVAHYPPAEDSVFRIPNFGNLREAPCGHRLRKTRTAAWRLPIPVARDMDTQSCLGSRRSGAFRGLGSPLCMPRAHGGGAGAGYLTRACGPHSGCRATWPDFEDSGADWATLSWVWRRWQAPVVTLGGSRRMSQRQPATVRVAMVLVHWPAAPLSAQAMLASDAWVFQSIIPRLEG